MGRPAPLRSSISDSARQRFPSLQYSEASARPSGLRLGGTVWDCHANGGKPAAAAAAAVTGGNISNCHPTDKVYVKLAAVKQPSLTDIKRHYVGEGRSLDAATEAALKEDPRPGARAILQAIARRRFENRAEGQRLRRLTRFERALWDKGIARRAGFPFGGGSEQNPIHFSYRPLGPRRSKPLVDIGQTKR